MSNKFFFTIDSKGDLVIRDLELESKEFTYEKYLMGEFDSFNYQYHENFTHYIYNDIGCDYERYGCLIQEGDVVLDIGANIGIFAHRAELRGASKVICFEPTTLAFECLTKNKGEKTIIYKNAVGNKNYFDTFITDKSIYNLGGATSERQDKLSNLKTEIITEQVFIININTIFDAFNRIDFIKIDVEGGEVDILNEITDENLKSIRCLATEFHKTYDEFDDFQEQFVIRMVNLGFKHFVLYHGNGDLRTLNFWK
jgi:FkbM family methyltransferase